MVGCSHCPEEAVFEVGWKGKNYCDTHFKRYFLGQVEKVLDKFEIEGKVAVAISGGKDSMACLHALSHFDRIEIRPFHIDLGIGDYSKKSLEAAEDMCQELGLNLDLIELEGKYDRTIPELSEEESGKSCGICGTVKRYLMNKYAYENELDHVATGHNLSDEMASTFNNLANVYFTPLRGMKPMLENRREYGLVSRVKPLYYLKDKEALVYSEICNVIYYHGECPLATDSPTDELKEWLHKLDSERPGILRNFAKSFMRLEDRTELDHGELKTCERCGYATSTKICRFCRLMERGA